MRGYDLEDVDDVEVMALLKVAKYQEIVGGMSYEDVMSENAWWIEFVIQAKSIENEIQAEQAKKK